ncbi:MAG TPA: flagellar biosynthesis protein FlhF [Candidatus Ozemobacteraceae bacterium]|nr:flagellar biosynthesis protein FlhF [Candidatus Ozemobacteraceae bacterium]
MMIQKFVADTYHEAHLKARMELGEDLIIIQSKTVPQKIWGGIYSREVVELTVAATRDKKEPPVVSAPVRPVPTEEITAAPVPHKPVLSSRTAAYPASSGAPQRPRADTSTTKSHHTGPQGLRRVHGIRSNQEGMAEPHSQRIEEEAQQTAKTLELLDAIIKHRNNKQPAAPTVPAPTPRAAAASAIRPPADETTDRSSLNALEQRLNELFTLIRDMKTSASQTLETQAATIPAGLMHLKRQFQNQEFPAEIIDEFIERLGKELPPLSIHNEKIVFDETAKWLKRLLHFTPHPQPTRPGPQIFALIGPTGVGKTTTIAKLAATYALNMKDRKSVALFTLDTYRIGGTQQLDQYANLIDATMEVLYEPDDVLPALERHQDKDIILVDTAGRCPKDAVELGNLRNFINLFGAIRTYLVLSATTKYSDMHDTVRRFQQVGFDELIFTKVDETDTIGPLVSLLYRTALPLAYLTDGQDVPDNFMPASAEYFVSRFAGTC